MCLTDARVASVRRERSRSRSRSRPARANRRRVYKGNPAATRLMLRRGRTTPSSHRFCKWGSPVSVNVNGGYYCPVTAGLGTLYSSPSVNEIDLGMTFAFSDLSESTQFTALYDQYKLRKIVLRVELITNLDASYFINQGSAVTNYANFFPRLWLIRDHDDSIAPTASGLASYSKVKERILVPNRTLRYSLKPSILESTYAGKRTVKFNSGWLDMADTNIPHYGIKCAIDFVDNYTNSTDLPAKPPTQANPNTSQWEFLIRAQYHFSCNFIAHVGRRVGLATRARQNRRRRSGGDPSTPRPALGSRRGDAGAAAESVNFLLIFFVVG